MGNISKETSKTKIVDFLSLLLHLIIVVSFNVRMVGEKFIIFESICGMFRLFKVVSALNQGI